MIDEVRDQLIEYLEDVHALEQHVKRQLQVLIETEKDPEFNQILRLHVVETVTSAHCSSDCRPYDRGPSAVKDAGAIFTAMSKGLIDKVRHAGDWATVTVAKRNGADEQRMANEIARRWERAVHVSLPRARARDLGEPTPRATRSADARLGGAHTERAVGSAS
ncbi:MAG: hypothetical protein ACRDKY_12040 [Solirubrobacteraceae bacterium]